jgi:2-polyprenyl-3-methyl-5-hydroxy-6-metoxy-1,4-benzoquinol methylase
MKTFEYHLSKSCPLCTAQTSQVLTTELRRGKGIVYFCGSCTHGFLMPDKDLDAKSYYAENYRQEYSHNAEATATNAREIFDIYKKYQRDRLALIVPTLKPDTRLLEVGASSGQFLVNVKDKVAEVNAVELDRACCDFMQSELNISADHEFLRQSKFADETYDVVCSFQVMEHVENPVGFLKDLRLSVRPGGKLFIEVPNLHDPLLTVWSVNAYKTFYYHSAHLHYFSEISLRRVARDAGFKPEQIEIQFHQDYNLLNHLNWVMNDAPQPTCNIGLSEVKFLGENAAIATWLTERMRELNEEYVARLVTANATSNLMMVLKND